MEIKYEGNMRDPFSLDLLENIRLASFIDGELGKVEHLGDEIDEETGQPFEYGMIIGSDINFDLFEDRLRVYSGIGYFVKKEPGTNNLTVSLDWPGEDRESQTLRVSPELTLPRPRTMVGFVIAIRLFIARIYSDANLQMGANLRYLYDRLNEPYIEPETDPDLPF